ncbi:hypothetical protein CEP52_012489 [Fusarium oligoseptatum]|uniref:RRM domain-containing protein n=1 Tax=Fusarium oligoseptatum TaxID=2604345 RepID=A0A428SYB9_9HYPO|nr:hypothetical protein CEP52_012489 [Fusarium oligoseptatum]
MGLPDTVNDARIRALVEPLGAIVKLIVLPANGGAKIEFADVATAGKASLQLNSMEFEGRPLRTGTVEELRQAKAERVQDRIVYGSFMPPPTTLRRPVLGKPGPRRGLGFKPSAPKAAQNGTETNGESVAGAKKSNADFKAMFLASGKEEKGNRKEGN